GGPPKLWRSALAGGSGPRRAHPVLIPQICPKYPTFPACSLGVQGASLECQKLSYNTTLARRSRSSPYCPGFLFIAVLVAPDYLTGLRFMGVASAPVKIARSYIFGLFMCMLASDDWRSRPTRPSPIAIKSLPAR